MKWKPSRAVVWAAAVAGTLAAGLGLILRGRGRGATAEESGEEEVEAHPS